jgi:hypothetical protein
MDQSDKSENGTKAGDKGCPEGQIDYMGTCLPPVDFSAFILSLASSAMVHLGEAPEPESGETKPALPLAKHTIDTLAMLEDKTKGNLSEEECRMLRTMVYELRLIFLRKAG